MTGRSEPPIALGGSTFGAGDRELTVLGVPFGAEERLWFLGLALFAWNWFTARALLRWTPRPCPGRPARQRDRRPA
ncbi:branched-chain amino acid ABC transporter permease [Streptomyces hirsutus]